MSGSSLLLGVLLVFGGMALSSCSSTSEPKESHPVPRTPIPEDAMAQYIKEGEHWYQFQIRLWAIGPVQKEEDFSARLEFRARAVVRRYNPKTREYDLASPEFPGPHIYRVFEFDFVSGEDLVLRMKDKGQLFGSGSGKWPYPNYTTARIEVSPDLPREGLQSRDLLAFDVIAVAEMDPEPSEGKRRTPITLEARQLWEAQILSPEKRIGFMRLD